MSRTRACRWYEPACDAASMPPERVFLEQVLRLQSDAPTRLYDLLFSTLVHCPVTIHNDWVSGPSVHMANIPPVYSGPLPTLELSKQFKEPGFAAQRNKLTRTVKHQLDGTYPPAGSIVLRGHDIGPFITHIDVPNLNSPSYPLNSSCKVMFDAAAVCMDGRAVACVSGSFSMLGCGDPVCSPLIFSMTWHQRTVFVGVSLSDILVGLARIHIEVVPDVLKYLIRRYKRKLQKVIEKFQELLQRVKRALKLLSKLKELIVVKTAEAMKKVVQGLKRLIREMKKILQHVRPFVDPLTRKAIEEDIKRLDRDIARLDRDMREIDRDIARARADGLRERKKIERRFRRADDALEGAKKVMDGLESWARDLLDWTRGGLRKDLARTVDELDRVRQGFNRDALSRLSRGASPKPAPAGAAAGGEDG